MRSIGKSNGTEAQRANWKRKSGLSERDPSTKWDCAKRALSLLEITAEGEDCLCVRSQGIGGAEGRVTTNKYVVPHLETVRIFSDRFSMKASGLRSIGSRLAVASKIGEVFLEQLAHRGGELGVGLVENVEDAPVAALGDERDLKPARSVR